MYKALLAILIKTHETQGEKRYRNNKFFGKMYKANSQTLDRDLKDKIGEKHLLTEWFI